MKFRVAEGSHTDLEGRTYRKGEVLESKKDLTKMWVNKFERVQDNALITKAGKETKPVEDDEEEKLEEESKKVEDDTSDEDDKEEDVTAEFPKAEEAGVKVLKHGKVYGVFDEDDLVTPLHEKPLRKNQVNGFIKTMIKE